MSFAWPDGRPPDVVDILVGDPDLVRLEVGDITQATFADAIVNAANARLMTGGGVAGAIHRAGGPELDADCARVRAEIGELQTGKAVATLPGRIPVKRVIHTVGPVWHGGSAGEPALLESCYRESMRLADELGLASIAFPAVSTGVFGYPLRAAAEVALPTVIQELRSARRLVLVAFVLFDRSALETFAQVALQLNERTRLGYY